MSAPSATRKELAVLKRINGLWDELGRSPTFREVADAMGYRSLATVHEHVVNMRRKGMLAEPERINAKFALVPTRRAA
jgi:SOS-response transcriptional repressor LexA